MTCESRLRQIRELLQRKGEPSADEVQQILGHGVLAGSFSCITEPLAEAKTLNSLKSGHAVVWPQAIPQLEPARGQTRHAV